MEVRNEEMKPYSTFPMNRDVLLLPPTWKVVLNTITGLTMNGITQI